MKIVTVLLCAAVFVGCGKSDSGGKSDGGGSSTSADNAKEKPADPEQLVKDLYSVVQSGDDKKAEQFAMDHFESNFREKVAVYDRDAKKVFKVVSGSKASVKTEVIKTLEANGKKASVISAVCDGTTLYFVVGADGKDNKILGYTTNKEKALAGGQ